MGDAAGRQSAGGSARKVEDWIVGWGAVERVVDDVQQLLVLGEEQLLSWPWRWPVSGCP
jgi:hypothetical protein